MSGALAGRVRKALREGHEEEKEEFFPQRARKEAEVLTPRTPFGRTVVFCWGERRKRPASESGP